MGPKNIKLRTANNDIRKNTGRTEMGYYSLLQYQINKLIDNDVSIIFIDPKNERIKNK